jgi:uncharacterized protein YgiM (DUF1202 family)
MIKRKIEKFLLLLLILIISISSKAEKYTALQDLNVRTEKSTNAQSLGIIHKGDIVDINEIIGIWGKLSFEGKDGFVSTKFLQKNQIENIPENNATQKQAFNTPLWIVLGLVIILLYIFRNSVLLKFIKNIMRNR